MMHERPSILAMSRSTTSRRLADCFERPGLLARKVVESSIDGPISSACFVPRVGIDAFDRIMGNASTLTTPDEVERLMVRPAK
jgi:hypothetical protein